jgi:hypothetical protein
MVDPFFRWLESTAVSAWIVESPSLFAFPGILAVHTVGLGLLAGLNGALDLRLLSLALWVTVIICGRMITFYRPNLCPDGGTVVIAACIVR